MVSTCILPAIDFVGSYRDTVYALYANVIVPVRAEVSSDRGHSL